MTIYVSGMAGFGVIERGPNWLAFDSSAEPVECGGSLIRQRFQGAYDVVAFENEAFEDARNALDDLVDLDENSTLLLIALDPDEDMPIRKDAAKLLGEAIDGKRAIALADHFAFSVPREFDYLSGAEDLCDEQSFALLIDRLNDNLRALDLVEASLAGAVGIEDTDAVEKYISTGRTSGITADAVKAVVEGRAANDIFIPAHKAFAQLPNHRTTVTGWIHAILPNNRQRSFDYASTAEDETASSQWRSKRFVRSDVRPPVRQIFDWVMRQQDAIFNLMREGNIGRARQFADELVLNQSKDSKTIFAVKTLCRLSQEARRLQLYHLQLEWALRATRFDAADSRAFGHLGSAYISNRSLAEAVDSFNECQARGGIVHALNGKARIARVRSNYDEALSLYREAQTVFSDDPDDTMHAWIGEASVLRAKSDLDAALQVYSKAQREFAGSPVPYCGVGAVLTDMGRIDEAIRHYDRTLSLFNNDEIAMYGKATALKEGGRFDNALSIYDNIARLYPTTSFGLFGRAEVLRMKGEFDDAGTSYRKSALLFPTISVFKTGLAELLKDFYAFEEAAAELRDTIKLFPDDIFPRVSLAATYKMSGDLSEALRSYELVLADHPFNASALNGKADVLRLMGHYDDASSIYRYVIDNYPNFRRARHGLSAVYASLGRIGEAAAMIPQKISDIVVKEDWVGYNIFLMAAYRDFDPRQFLSVVKEAQEAVPFARYKKMFVNSHAFASLRLKEFGVAEELLRQSADPAVKIVWIHALLKNGRENMAREAYEDLKRSKADVASDLRDILIVKAASASSRDDSEIHGELIHLDREIFLRSIAA